MSETPKPVPQKWMGHKKWVGDYYPFGLTMAGISSKALAFGGPENKYKYNGIEYENSFAVNIGETFFRTHDPQLGRWWQIDPKPSYETSLYAAMLNNPIKLSDPLGDTTWTYDISGTFLKMIPDKLKNQTHYIEKVEYDKLEASNTTDGKLNNKNMGNAVRKNSSAFIGKNSLKSLQKILSDPANKGLESLFVGKVGSDREIMFSQVDVPDEYRSVSGISIPGNSPVNTAQHWINKAFPGNQSNLFMVGHTHVQEKLDMLLGKNTTVGDGSPKALLKFWARPSAGGDYNTADFHRNKIPQMIATPIGISLFSQAQYVNEKYGYQLFKQY
ncbi:hypothetical protein LZZ85_27945 [Terrimonas sp. NA20]|uniref:RHS repeat-associated core domain-containing protein n=1 Tax=Terrimonas ginsenosidimutans TaxID=2908004 RepID=A0ABS9L0T8_9BACT|nr:RHS repeat-associated core domain-containing protein [Terrimonas ginsenosidimutans]MCG2618165.1 hypothetical protein [Terrimonas ginsenosidimutans]